MKYIYIRLRSRCGETLVEAMISILVFTLSSVLLFSMITAATNINKATRDADAERQAQLSVAEADPVNGADGMNVSISFDALDDSHSTSIPVLIAQADGKPNALYSFSRPAAEPEAGGDTE